MKEKEIILHFQHLYELIQDSRSRALFSVNHQQLDLFWQEGSFINNKLLDGSWGDKVVEQFSVWLKEKDVSIKNFDRRNIYHMREFFLAYFEVNFQAFEDKLSIVVSTKPQIENIENNANEHK